MGRFVQKKVTKNKSQFKKVRWTFQEDFELKTAINEFGTDWLQVAQRFPNRNPNQCSQRWKKLNKGKATSQKKQFWTQEEDAKLIQLINIFGKNWKLIEENFIGRNSKQCCDRYSNNLDPNLKVTEFTDCEDQIIYENFLIHGPKWSKIADILSGRSQNQVKNRFYSVIRTDYLQIKNPYFSKQTQEEAKNELEQARQKHLLFIQNEQNPSLLYSDEILDFQSDSYISPLLQGGISNHNSNSETSLNFL